MSEVNFFKVLINYCYESMKNKLGKKRKSNDIQIYLFKKFQIFKVGNI